MDMINSRYNNSLESKEVETPNLLVVSFANIVKHKAREGRAREEENREGTHGPLMY